jgi:hypothetical protein
LKPLEAMLGVPKAEGSRPGVDEDEWTEAGQDMLDAIESKDAEAIGLVLKRMCGDYGDDEEATDEE